MLSAWSSGYSRLRAQLRVCTVALLIGVIGLVALPTTALGIPDSTVEITFRIDSTGSGSGTISSPSFECGTSCVPVLEFGRKISLVAHPGRDSRFVQWQGACSSKPTCELEVGPVTSVRAVFDKDPPPRSLSPGRGSDSPSPNQPSDPQSPDRASPGVSAAARPFVAKLSRVKVRGRLVTFRLRVNGAADVRTNLMRKRRSVIGRRWRVRPGSNELRWEIARRVRPGDYEMSLMVRRTGSPPKRFTRAVRLVR